MSYYYDIDYELIAEEMLEKGHSHDEILDSLIRRGLEPFSAEVVLESALKVERRRAFWNGAMAVTGALILLGTFGLITNAHPNERLLMLSYASIPLAFGFSMLVYGIRRRGQ